MSDLTEFLLERIAEDEGAANVLADLPFNFRPDRLKPETVRVLASTYADHPDYDESWRP